MTNLPPQGKITLCTYPGIGDKEIHRAILRKRSYHRKYIKCIVRSKHLKLYGSLSYLKHFRKWKRKHERSWIGLRSLQFNPSPVTEFPSASFLDSE